MFVKNLRKEVLSVIHFLKQEQKREKRSEVMGGVV
jgi:membrane-bound lytic murein transglycosylase MltF